MKELYEDEYNNKIVKVVDTDNRIWIYNEKKEIFEIMPENVVDAKEHYYLRDDGTFWETTLAGKKNCILKDVASFSFNYYYTSSQNRSLIFMVRKDGSIWKYDPGSKDRVPVMVYGPEESIVLGDLSGDGDTTMKDVQLMFAYIGERGELTEQQLSAADVDGDSKVTMRDAQKLYYFINGRSDEL